jgi:hypothetical protein
MSTFSATPLGRNVPLYFFTSGHSHPMTFDQLESYLSVNSWQPIEHSVPNFSYVKQNKGSFAKDQLFKLIQHTSSGLFGSIWFIVLA